MCNAKASFAAKQTCALQCAQHRPMHVCVRVCCPAEFLGSPSFYQLLSRLRLHAEQHARDHWAQCSRCRVWRIISWQQQQELLEGGQVADWTCRMLRCAAQGLGCRARQGCCSADCMARPQGCWFHAAEVQQPPASELTAGHGDRVMQQSHLSHAANVVRVTHACTSPYQHANTSDHVCHGLYAQAALH
jgi:hypothetical protein